MIFELFLSLRYLKAKRKQAFISVITVISILGVTVGVMALIVVLSVMNGFRADLMGKILGVNSHLLVLNFSGPFGDYENTAQRIRAVEGVVGASPFIYSQVMVSKAGNSSGAILRGIDIRSAGQVLAIESMIKFGKLADLEGKTESGLPKAIVGRELCRQIAAITGDEISVMAPEGKLTPMGRSPNTKRFVIAGVFDSGMYEYDASMLYVTIPEAQDLLGVGDKVTGIEARVKDMDRSESAAKAIEEELGYPFWTKDWKVMNRSLFSALKLEKITMFIILTMIVLVGALNIISTLVMVVMEKTRDIAILRAMGASGKSIMTVFMLQGLLVGVVGTAVGLGLGLGICHVLAVYKFISLPADVYYISTLPVRVEWLDVLFVSSSAVIISFLATVYPARYAARLNPVEALRYE
jgi:lipoprotein-releasing system permease protein